MTIKGQQLAGGEQVMPGFGPTGKISRAQEIQCCAFGGRTHNDRPDLRCDIVSDRLYARYAHGSRQTLPTHFACYLQMQLIRKINFAFSEIFFVCSHHVSHQ
jgi:hypothetical protein